MVVRGLLAFCVFSFGCQTVKPGDSRELRDANTTFKQMTFYAPNLDSTVLVAKRVAEGRFETEDEYLGMFALGGRLATVIGSESAKRTSAAASRQAVSQAARRVPSLAADPAARLPNISEEQTKQLFSELRKAQLSLLSDAAGRSDDVARARRELNQPEAVIAWFLLNPPNARTLLKKARGKGGDQARQAATEQWRQMTDQYHRFFLSPDSGLFASGWQPPQFGPKELSATIQNAGLGLAEGSTTEDAGINSLLERLGVAVRTTLTPAADRYLTFVAQQGDDVFLVPANSLTEIVEVDPEQPFFVGLETSSHELLVLNVGTRDGFLVFEVIGDNDLAEIWAAQHLPKDAGAEDFGRFFDQEIQTLMSKLAPEK